MWDEADIFSEIRQLIKEAMPMEWPREFWWERPDAPQWGYGLPNEIVGKILLDSDQYLKDHYQKMTTKLFRGYSWAIRLEIIEAWSKLPPKIIYSNAGQLPWEQLQPWQQSRYDQREYESYRLRQEDEHEWYRNMEVGDLDESTDIMWYWQEYWSQKIKESEISAERLELPEQQVLKKSIGKIRNYIQALDVNPVDPITIFYAISTEIYDVQGYLSKFFEPLENHNLVTDVAGLTQGYSKFLYSVQYALGDISYCVGSLRTALRENPSIIDQKSFKELLKQQPHQDRNKLWADYKTYQEKRRSLPQLMDSLDKAVEALFEPRQFSTGEYGIYWGDPSRDDDYYDDDDYYSLIDDY